jgi:hypothetical protein
MTPIYRAGSYCDVAVWIDGRLLNVVVNGLFVDCFLENDRVWSQNTPEPLMFCRGAVQGNLMLTLHQGHDSGAAMLIGNGLVRSLGPTFGVQPVGLDAHEAYVVRLASTYDRIGLVTQSFPSPVPTSSQGISDVQPDGTVWFADAHRSIVISGVTFTYPNTRGPVTVGQVDGGIAAAVDGKVTLVIPAANAFEPHVAVSPNGRVAICARTDQGAAYVPTTLNELRGV